ncbi:MAG: hypothetical protein GX552_11840 [Chloroflexi bacterium]|nr:hypothetical protein [Chloroflexota bacterium]
MVGVGLGVAVGVGVPVGVGALETSASQTAGWDGASLTAADSGRPTLRPVRTAANNRTAMQARFIADLLAKRGHNTYASESIVENSASAVNTPARAPKTAGTP